MLKQLKLCPLSFQFNSLNIAHHDNIIPQRTTLSVPNTEILKSANKLTMKILNKKL